jgi:hypothetical protein
MEASELGVKALADDLSFSRENGAHHRVGAHPAVSARCELKRAAKVKPFVVCGHRGRS